jgi:DNA (cytosine-5)-methyltransferase 1
LGGENVFLTVDLFCGAGGMGLGFKKAGFEVAGAFDFDKYAVESYKYNVSPLVSQVDITKMDLTWLPNANVWTFGFPCQDLSVAGKQAGLIEGKRSKMFFEVMRLLAETREHLPINLPSVIVAENVKQLKKYLPIVEAEYNKVGYNMYYTLYNSKYWGVPQNRERYFVVGIQKDLDDGSFSFLPEQKDNIPVLASVLESNVNEKYYYSDEKSARLMDIIREVAVSGDPMEPWTTKDGAAYACNARYFRGAGPADVRKNRNTQIVEPQIEVLGTINAGTTQEHNNRVHDPAGISPTATAVAGGSHHKKIFDYPKYRVRKLTPREYARLQAFPESFEFVVSDTQLYKQFGNAVTVTVAEAVATAVKNFLEGIRNEKRI